MIFKLSGNYINGLILRKIFLFMFDTILLLKKRRNSFRLRNSKLQRFYLCVWIDITIPKLANNAITADPP
jgi:hypothetical protein